MIIETFRDTKLVRERFERCGRLLPEGVTYHASWIDPVANRCFQVMEAPDQEALKRWTSLWDDLIDFEIVPVLTSIEFWSDAQLGYIDLSCHRFNFRSAVRLTIDWPGEHYQLRNLVGIRLEAAVKVAGKLVNLLSQVYPIGPLMLHISTSIGVSEYPHSGASIVELLASADAAMYKAKAARRRRVASAA